MKSNALAVCVNACMVAAMVSSCGQPQSGPKSVAKVFFDQVAQGEYITASQYVLDEDMTKLYETWKPMTKRVKALKRRRVEVILDDSRATGEAVCSGSVISAAGDASDNPEVTDTVRVGLARVNGDWWIRIHELLTTAPDRRTEDAKVPPSGSQAFSPSEEPEAE